MRDLSWRVYLCAVLLCASDIVSGDFNDGNGSESSGKSGYPDPNDVDNSNDSIEVDDSEAIAAAIASLHSNKEIEEDKRRSIPESDNPANGITYNVGLDENDYIAPSGNPGVNDVKSTIISDQFIEPVVHDELVFPKDPTPEGVATSNEYPYFADNETESGQRSFLFNQQQKLFTRLIPIEEHVLLHKIPGAENAIRCSQEGELYNFWAPGLQCMVCACLRSYGRLRSVCVSCQSCMLPPEPPTTRYPPVTTPEPTQPPVPDTVSCSPLPVGVPVQSPLDPCKICVCSETLDQWGRVDVRIDCKHNPQCVLPTTQAPIVTTPVPQHVCDKLPPNVRFPHPQDACKICRCVPGRDPYGRDHTQVVCELNPECQPTSIIPPPPPTSPAPPNPSTDIPGPEICNRYPENVLFPHPHDTCQVCKCTVQSNLFYDKRTVTCYILPSCNCSGHPENVWFRDPSDPCQYCQCIKDYTNLIQVIKKNCHAVPDCVGTSTRRPITTIAPPTTPPQPDNVRCAPLPVNSPFQSPINPCQVCVCNEEVDPYGRIVVSVECQENPQCVLPQNQTTLSPDIITTDRPLAACKNYPENVLFPHPYDRCQVCRCYSLPNSHGGRELMINCETKPECSPTTRPPPTPANPTCYPLPVAQPFQHPLQPCQTCTCSEVPSPHGLDVRIECRDNHQCVLPPDHTTLPPDIIDPVKLKECRYFPENVYFPHPEDPCEVCKCNVVDTRQELVISCIVKPECLPSPPPPTPTPSTETPPEPVQICDHYPDNMIFQAPMDECKLCKCYRDPRQGYKRVITCFVKPDCIPAPSTTKSPVPIASCAPLPVGRPFQSPANPCQICMCSERTDLFGRHDATIECKFNQQCTLPPITPTIPPVIVVPVRWPICKQYPMNVFFPHPSDVCSQCKCTLQTNNYGQQEAVVGCVTLSDCLPTPPTPPIISTEPPVPEGICRPPYGKLVPDPTDPCRVCKCDLVDTNRGPEQRVTCFILPKCRVDSPCDNREVDVVFTDPSDPCRMCMCYYSPGVGPSSGPSSQTELGHFLPKKQIQCTLKPECYPPTPEPQKKDVSCAPLKPGVPYPSPLNPCAICICTETVDAYGRPDVRIKCQENPQCVLPPDHTTLPPIDPTSPTPLPACKDFPTNVLFPHPRDPCLVCKCSVELTQWGHPEQTVTCFDNFDNPQCARPVTSTPAPWPPVTPPGPLPGPAPHESCAPYQPGAPFQHPWDECQVCVCTEAISTDRITIEVNCYTSPSCCYEPPIDSPGTGAIAGPASVGSSSGNLISGSSDPKMIAPPGSLVYPTSGSLLKTNGGNIYGGPGQDRREQDGDTGSQKKGGQQIKDISEGSLSHVVKGTSSGGNRASSNRGTIGSSSGNFVRPGGAINGNFGASSGTIIRPGAEAHREQTLHYSLNSEASGGRYETVVSSGPHIVSGVPLQPGQKYSTKMRTKSARPRDDDTEDYD